MKEAIKILTLIVVPLLIMFYLSPIYIPPKEGHWNASEDCKEKGWSDWYGWHYKFGRDIIICDSGIKVINKAVWGMFKIIN